MTLKKLAGAISFASTITFAGLTHAIQLVGSLLLSGIIRRDSTHSLTSSISFSSLLKPLFGRFLSGSMSFAGNAAKQTAHSLTGAVSFVGGFLRKLNHKVKGIIGSFTSTAQQNISGATDTTENKNIHMKNTSNGNIKPGEE